MDWVWKFNWDTTFHCYCYDWWRGMHIQTPLHHALVHSKVPSNWQFGRYVHSWPLDKTLKFKVFTCKYLVDSRICKRVLYETTVVIQMLINHCGYACRITKVKLDPIQTHTTQNILTLSKFNDQQSIEFHHYQQFNKVFQIIPIMVR